MFRSSQCTTKEIKPATLSCISSSSQLSKETKKAFFFKGKLRKVGQYIFLLHNINSYKKFRCKMETVKLAFHSRQQAVHYVNRILLPAPQTLSYFHSQATLSSCSCTGANSCAPIFSALCHRQRVTLKADACLCLFTPGTIQYLQHMFDAQALTSGVDE